jgi:hypothetical protein
MKLTFKILFEHQPSTNESTKLIQVVILIAAKIEDSRIYDLRHQFATSAASAGVSMPNLMGCYTKQNL